MAGSGDKVLRVGGASYVIDESAGTDIAMIVSQVEEALGNGTVVKVPVFDADKNRVTLYLNGGRVDALTLDTNGGDRPGVISPSGVTA